ncbi:MAG TPA: hypothetical protein VGF58_05395 [Burkholderiales bacterium]
MALTGCASTKVETTGKALQKPLCKSDGSRVAALVYWGPQWRPDQKEPERREVAALRGIESFIANSECLARVDVRRLPGGSTAEVPPDEALLEQASAAAARADKVLVIVVRELGPVLRIGIPWIVEGGTEVVLEVRLLDVPTSSAQANARTHWWNGGTFVIKGVGSLDRDMSAALAAALAPR